jgi:hypothetical protein
MEAKVPDLAQLAVLIRMIWKINALGQNKLQGCETTAGEHLKTQTLTISQIPYKTLMKPQILIRVYCCQSSTVTSVYWVSNIQHSQKVLKVHNFRTDSGAVPFFL